ncbi:tetratricopeptide repeat protein, partial [Nocardia barduliensis]|uniref:tetratricopeptide repeat protein n=1 Tax=Nocardia barduliensis TaxID=2736643 RepID=UPI0015737268
LGIRRVLLRHGVECLRHCSILPAEPSGPASQTKVKSAVVPTVRVLGPDHPDTSTVRNNLAQTFQSTGRLTEAIPLFEQLLSRREQELGSDHSLTWALRDFLAVMRVWRWK